MAYDSIHPALHWDVLTKLVKKGEQKLSMAGLEFFPEIEVSGDEFEWAETTTRNYIAPIVSDDNPLILTTKDSITFKRQKLPLIRRGSTVSRRDIIELMRQIRLNDEGAVNRLLENIGAGLMSLMGQVARTCEYLRFQALRGAINYDAFGIKIDIDFGIPSANRITLTGGDRWNQDTAKPLKNLQTITNLATNAGVKLTDVLMNNTTAQLLIGHSTVIEFLKVQYAKELLDVEKGTTFIAEQFKLKYTQVDDIWQNDAGTVFKMIPDNVVIFVCRKDSTGTEVLGRTAVGQAHLFEDGTLSPPGIFAQTKIYTDPLSPNKSVSEVKKVALPILEHNDWVYILTVV